jgi:hypothetical protein
MIVWCLLLEATNYLPQHRRVLRERNVRCLNLDEN